MGPPLIFRKAATYLKHYFIVYRLIPCPRRKCTHSAQSW